MHHIAHLHRSAIPISHQTVALSHLNSVDWVIIGLYFIFVIGIGAYAQKNMKNSDDFFIAGRKNGSWIAGIAFLSANMGALELLGMSGTAYSSGLMTAHFYLIGAIPAMLFLAIFMMPFYYHSKIYSVPGYLGKRFNQQTRALNAVAFAIMTLLMAGINMYSMALVLNVFVGWSFNVSIWVSSATVAVYIVLGGLESAIFSEVMQFFLIWFGMFLAVILGYVHVGGWNEIVHRIPQGYTHLWAGTHHASGNPMAIDWVGIVFGLGVVLSFGYWCTDFLVIQRALSAKNLRAAQTAPVIAAFFKMALPFMIVTAGVVAIVLVKNHTLPHLSRPDDALLYVINSQYPHGLLGLGVTALLAGFMAGQAGNISAFNTVFTEDIYRGYFVKDAEDHHYITVGRVVTVLGVLISVGTAYWAMEMSSIMSYMQALFSIVNAPLFGVIVLGMFWKRINGAGGFTGLFTGMALSLILFLLVQFHTIPASDIALTAATTPMAADLWRAIWACAASVVVTIVVSLMTKRPPEERLIGYVYGTIPDATYEKVVWYRRPTFWAVIALIAFAGFNIIFW
jgi:SSS family solute:Na+ symporter